MAVYLKAWILSSSAISAPRHLLKRLVVTLKIFQRHLWYLREYLTGLALFDEEVPSEVKSSIIKNLKRQGHHEPKIAEVKHVSICLQLCDFIISNVCELFLA